MVKKMVKTFTERKDYKLVTGNIIVELFVVYKKWNKQSIGYYCQLSEKLDGTRILKNTFHFSAYYQAVKYFETTH
jgi:hypothetical protein